MSQDITELPITPSTPAGVDEPGPDNVAADGGTPADRRGQIAWALFEWARNPYVLLITIYVFAPYFSNQVVGDPVQGQAIWGYINGFAGVTIALLAPFLGAIADLGGSRKPWIGAFTLLMVPAMVVLWFALPDDGGIGIAGVTAAIIIIAVAYEFSAVFHNSMLPSIAPHSRIGFLSGLGLALGNLGGLLILIFMLVFFTLPGNVPWGFVPDTPLFGLDQSLFQDSRISGPVSGLWLAVFALPLFFFTPDAARNAVGLVEAMRQGVARVMQTLRKLRHYRNVATYLGARMLYNDGKTAVLIFGGVYAAGVFGWGALDMLVYGIVLSVFAVLGGFLGGWLDDTFGSKAAILISIGGTTLGLLLAVSITPDEIFFQPYPDAQPVWSLPFFQTLPEMLYLGVVLLIAIFITAAYANSRTMLARIAPADMMTEFFGLYALSGTATAFVAPILVGWSTDVFDSQRAGFASILVLLIAGMVVMLYVREVRAERAPEDQ
ncbi:MFS transporter [Pyruvatibacter mobilis]|uniref:MFS transporter n=1 Tax=Pyruvatibacter mobilis TaxID=1712261 RepID=UPI003BB0CA96